MRSNPYKNIDISEMNGWRTHMDIMEHAGNFEDIENIFFGSTTKRVLRFIKRPVLCLPENEVYKFD